MTRPFRTRLLAGLGAVTLAGLMLADPAFATGANKADGDPATSESWNTPPDAGDNRHPSGKDRSVENGGSGTQGKSKSDPDGMTNGGADKPGGTGGIDRGDQDGNNGCGNDDDFEDDNNGNCGGKHKDHSRSCTAKSTKSPSDDSMKSGCKTTAKPATSECPKAASMSKSSSHSKSSSSKSRHSSTCAKSAPKSCSTTTGASSSTCPKPTSTCPAGMVDSNGAQAGGCVKSAAAGDTAKTETSKSDDSKVHAQPATVPTTTTTTAASAVSGTSASGGSTGGAAAASASAPAQGEVMGISAQAAPAAGTAGADTLPFTGAGSTVLLIGLAAACIVAGTALTRRSA